MIVEGFPGNIKTFENPKHVGLSIPRRLQTPPPFLCIAREPFFMVY
jgi:hypothetical protein